MAKSVQWRPGETARPAASFLTPPSDFDLSTMMPHAWPSSAQAGLLTVSGWRSAPKIAPSAATTDSQRPLGVAAKPRIVHCIGIKTLAGPVPLIPV